jgi:hypothetical protein
MKNKTKIVIAILLGIICIAAPFSVAQARNLHAQTYEGDKFLIGESFTLSEGEILNGNLVMLGGTLTTEAGSTINGDLVIMGGTLSLAGTVEGDVVSLGGTGNVASSAVVTGNLVSTGGWLNVSPQATISGTKNINTPGDRKFDFSKLWNRTSSQAAARNPWSVILWSVFRSLALAALAALVVLIFPKPSDNAAATVRTSAAVSWLVGCLTLFILPLVLLIMGITIILIPVIPLVIFVLAVGIIFGFITLGYEIGLKLEEMTRANWAPPIAAGIGVVLLSLVLHGISIIPCMGFISLSIVFLIALGLVILSRFGTRKYPVPPRSFTSSVVPPGGQNPPSGSPSEDQK